MADESMNIPHREIFIVDDDPQVSGVLSFMFMDAGYQVTSFADGSSLLPVARSRTPACIILDIYMPGRSGLQILRELDAPHYGAPILIASGRATVPTAVEAIKNGAFDFLEKGTGCSNIVARVDEVVRVWEQRHRYPEGKGAGVLALSFPGRNLLTPREYEVLVQIAAAATNKEAARNLGISPRTVEVHRARIMKKLLAKNSADLVRIVMAK